MGIRHNVCRAIRIDRCRAIVDNGMMQAIRAGSYARNA